MMKFKTLKQVLIVEIEHQIPLNEDGSPMVSDENMKKAVEENIGYCFEENPIEAVPLGKDYDVESGEHKYLLFTSYDEHVEVPKDFFYHINSQVKYSSLTNI